jgi:hypothetical protein
MDHILDLNIVQGTKVAYIHQVMHELECTNGIGFHVCR